MKLRELCPSQLMALSTGKDNSDMKSQHHLCPCCCPCCGSFTIDEPGTYEVCAVCRWEDDPVQSRDSSYSGGANYESLNDFRDRWRKEVTRVSDSKT